MNELKRKNLVDKFMTGVFYTVGVFFLIFLAAFVFYVVINGIREYQPEFLSFSAKGIGNQLFNTVYLVILSLIISIPFGITTGVYLSEYSKQGNFAHFLRICIETLSSLPSIVLGLFGYLVFIILTGSKWNLLAGALTVSILNLPLIITTTEDAIRSLPKKYFEASYALGATKWQTIYKVILPASIPRILTGIILAAGRIFGEAAALLYTAGMSTDIHWNNWNISSITCPLNPFRPGETLALNIWAMRTEAISPDASKLAGFSSAILIILVFAFSFSARLIGKRLNKKMGE